MNPTRLERWRQGLLVNGVVQFAVRLITSLVGSPDTSSLYWATLCVVFPVCFLAIALGVIGCVRHDDRKKMLALYALTVDVTPMDPLWFDIYETAKERQEAWERHLRT